MATQDEINTQQAGEESAEGLKSQEMLLNMGPQHPSTHGVLRLVLTLEGETIIDCMPVIGYLHRGMEKIFENRPYMGGIPLYGQFRLPFSHAVRNCLRGCS